MCDKKRGQQRKGSTPQIVSEKYFFTHVFLKQEKSLRNLYLLSFLQSKELYSAGHPHMPLACTWAFFFFFFLLFNLI